MNEAETRAELIDPALKAAGWGDVPKSRVRREVIAPGRLLGSRQREKPTKCDYVLVYRNHKLAALEAKKRDAYPTEGLGQAKDYAERLKTRFALCTNGDKIYQVDMLTGNEEYIDRYPTPDELWAATYPSQNDWRDRFAAIPFEDKGGTWEARYYQHNAIEAVLEAISQGKKRMLLTMATGTGKTFMTKKGDESTANFYDYPPDFFDIVIVDECHRGGANDESTWRKILEYFAPAVQLGLTATPKRDVNGDTYKYFGEPLYTYSLKEGINEGYLTPFKVIEFTTTLDEYQYDPDDDLLEGDIDKERELDIQEGVGELDRQKLPQLLSLKYHTTNDAIAILGNIQTINEIFTNFQPHLYSDKVVS